MSSLEQAINAFTTKFHAAAHKSVVFRTIFVRYPQIGGGLMSAFKAAGADYFAQTQIGSEQYKKNGINWRRNFLFALLGFTHGGFINYFVHSYMNPKLFGHNKNPITIAKIILFNQFVYTPVFAFPVFYSYRGLVYSNGSLTAAKESLHVYFHQNISKDVMMAFKVWGPAHIVTYTLIGRRYRVFWINMVSFIWTAILSSMRGENIDQTETETQVQAQTEIEIDTQTQLQQLQEQGRILNLDDAGDDEMDQEESQYQLGYQLDSQLDIGNNGINNINISGENGNESDSYNYNYNINDNYKDEISGEMEVAEEIREYSEKQIQADLAEWKIIQTMEKKKRDFKHHRNNFKNNKNRIKNKIKNKTLSHKNKLQNKNKNKINHNENQNTDLELFENKRIKRINSNYSQYQ